MSRLGEEKPTFGQQARELDDECERGAGAGSQQQCRDSKRQQQKPPLHALHDRPRLAVKKLARIERTAHEALGFLHDVRVRDADGALQG